MILYLNMMTFRKRWRSKMILKFLRHPASTFPNGKNFAVELTLFQVTIK